MVVSRGVRLAWRVQARFPGHQPAEVLKALLRRHRIRVAQYPFSDDLAGIFIQVRGRPLIGVNCWDTPQRQTFAVAHELGHYLLGHQTGLHTGLLDSDDRTEREANAFAAEILMPAGQVAELVADGLDPDALAYLFGVSREAISWRLKELGMARHRRAQ